jgi:hypothetical protein
MSDLRDYRTEFSPDVQFTDFSKEFLRELLKFYGRAYMALDGFWYIGLLNETDNDFTLKVDHWAWEKCSRFELKRLAPLAGIEGNGIDALFKFLQLVPWMQVTDYRLEIESPHRGTLAVSKCSILEGMEKAGDGRERLVCSQVDAAIFRAYARYFNPDIKVEPLLLPPREDRQGICCRWEFTLE